MKTASLTAKAAEAATGTGSAAAFARFVVCGGGVTLAGSAVLVPASAAMPFAVANALVTVVSTVVTTELHARVSFRSAERGWRPHLKSALTVLASFLVTTAAMLGLHAWAAHPGVLAEQATYLGACGLAGIGRFAVLRLLVFARPQAAKAPRPAAQPELGRGGVAMAA
ncbi:GtrA family protein [Uniformispora flossi]|uniref:GtrA family protein n=1 Tax=Uniformispora flossi TaxID=3390723 RepID=UPI003C309712